MYPEQGSRQVYPGPGSPSYRTLGSPLSHLYPALHCTVMVRYEVAREDTVGLRHVPGPG